MRGGAPVFIFVVAMALLLVMWSLPFSDCQIPGRYERCGYLFSFRRYFMCCAVKPPALAGGYKALLFYHSSSHM